MCDVTANVAEEEKVEIQIHYINILCDVLDQCVSFNDFQQVNTGCPTPHMNSPHILNMSNE